MEEKADVLAERGVKSGDGAEESKDDDTEYAKPSFEDFSASMNTRGYWPEQSADIIKQYYKGEKIDDVALKNAMGSQNWASQLPCSQQCLYLTVLALYVLKEVFSEREEEWQLLAQKAKKLLKECGVKSVDGLLKEITIKLS